MQFISRLTYIISLSLLCVLYCSANDKTKKEKHSFIFTGDLLLGVNFPDNSYLPAKDGELLFRNVKNILRDADVTFGNLEGCFLDGGINHKKCDDSTLCYVFSMPESYVKLLVDAGYDALSIANNHVGDFFRVGQERTQEVLKAANISFAGISGDCESTIINKGDMKYGFCAFAPNAGMVNINDIETAKIIIANLKSKCHIVIVSFHGGAEGSAYNRVKDTMEMYHGERRGNVYRFARECIEAGADIVFGHGPHVPRAVDLYKNKFIAYSLGNFCTAGPVNIRGKNGYAPIIKVLTDKNGNFINGRIFSSVQRDKTGPVIDENNLSAKEIKRLTELDFPHSALRITKDGYINIK